MRGFGKKAVREGSLLSEGAGRLGEAAQKTTERVMSSVNKIR